MPRPAVTLCIFFVAFKNFIVGRKQRVIIQLAVLIQIKAMVHFSQLYNTLNFYLNYYVYKRLDAHVYIHSYQSCQKIMYHTGTEKML